MAQFEREFDNAVLEEDQQEIKEPSMYKVYLLNDDYTPMDFVVEVLVSIFHKTPTDATRIMLDVHKKGRGLVGLYTFDIAATKTQQVTQKARSREFPLKSVMEEA